MTPRVTEADYQVVITYRNSDQVVCVLPCTDAEGGFDYRQDTYSEADYRFIVDDDCCDCLQDVREWGHELAFWREGATRASWTGPITYIRTAGGAVEIFAKDRSYWLRRRLANRNILLNADAALAFVELFDEANALDPIGLVLPTIDASGINVTRTILKHESLWQHWNYLSELAMDWTVIGNRIIVGSPEIPLLPISLTADHFDGLVAVERDGELTANYIVVVGANGIEASYPPGEASWPRVEADAFYGLHQAVYTVDEIGSEEEARALAKAIWERQSVGQLGLDTGELGTLNCKAPLTLDDLVPGRILNIGIDSCLRVDEGMRLNRVQVQLTNCAETGVIIEMEPVGTFGNVS